MNKKGFTLIELLAIIVILGIIMIIAIPGGISYLKKSKEKSEEIFLNELSNVIDDYIALSSSSLTYGNCGLDSCQKTKCRKYKDNDTTKECLDSSTVSLVKATITFNNIINDVTSMIVAEDLINPNGKVMCDASNAIEIFRDSEYVYCHRVDLSCVTGDKVYDIDTCKFGS